MIRATKLPRAREPLPVLLTYSRRRAWFARVALEAAVVLAFVAFVLCSLGVVFGHG
jgi:hypothetical protein